MRIVPAGSVTAPARIISHIFTCCLLLWSAGTAPLCAAAAIDREALVSRHNPRLDQVDPWAALSVGNGRFAFTVDATGLQTLRALHRDSGIPLETQARWSWHSEPNPAGYRLNDAGRPYRERGRVVNYPTDAESPAGQWLRRNPHLQPLPVLSLLRPAGADIEPGELDGLEQELDLWTGVMNSRYTLDGEPVRVTVAAHPAQDVLAVRVESPLLASGGLAIGLDLPRGHDLSVKLNPPLDWSHPESHRTELLGMSGRLLYLRHVRDRSEYFVRLESTGEIHVEPSGRHGFLITSHGRQSLEFSIGFFHETGLRIPEPAAVLAASRRHWPAFWKSGGAVDFSGSTDPRAQELERRVVLSQYLTAIQMAADFPPQESGLTHNSWYGKHHTEMIWWHAAHFALWGRDDLLRKNLEWYLKDLPVARELARHRGLEGARWAKMVGPEGRESPGGNPLIVWNQPHVIYLAELLYRNHPESSVLEKYRELVLESAAGMASMLDWDVSNDRYNLGPPLWIAQEIHDPAQSVNPACELSYWSWGLQTAQLWRERLGLERDPGWDERIRKLAPMPVRKGRYVALESIPDTWDNRDSRHDHPSFLMALGQLPGAGVDRGIMNATLDAVLSDWDWETKIWGWDYPMIAMTAARLGRSGDAVDILLFRKGPNNDYTASGHCPQRDDIPVYLPANGALLAAVALMAAGWDGAADIPAPGFPQDGSWRVRVENIAPLP